MSGPAAGWYSDPNEPSQQKWWDGKAWTPHVVRPSTMPVTGETYPSPGPRSPSTQRLSEEQLGDGPQATVHPATVPAAIGAFFLLLAYLGGPYELYVITRWAVTAAAIWVSIIAGAQKSMLWAVVFVAIAVLFNPLIPVYATREFWIPFDVAGLVLFWVAGVKLRTSKPTMPELSQRLQPATSTSTAPQSQAKGPLQANSPVAGWYTDPNNPSRERWWDGGTWTPHTQAKASTKQPANPVAATGFAFGIASFFLFTVPIFGLILSLAAIVLSAMGLPQAYGTPKKYRVFAIIGLVLGVVYALMATLFLIKGR